MPRVVDAAAERDGILDRCLLPFARDGYGLVRMRDVARAAGVSTGKLYHYFPDKRSIAVALLDRELASDVEALRLALAATASAAERRAAFLRFLDARQDRLAATLLLALDHQRVEGPGAAAAVLRAYRDAMSALLGIDADVVMTLVLGLLARRVLDPAGLDLARHWDAVADQLGPSRADDVPMTAS
ncbi:MAG: TetR/AcrR family transcriptional regulator [Deltaproteobacteria bacterium]|nr:TetR/AcrR family transcriptional regulator [Deltaproteobacteria bacterium]